MTVTFRHSVLPEAERWIFRSFNKANKHEVISLPNKGGRWRGMFVNYPLSLLVFPYAYCFLT